MTELVFALTMMGIALFCIHLTETTKEVVREIVGEALPSLPDPLDEEFRQLEAEVAKRDAPPTTPYNAVTNQYHHYGTWNGTWESVGEAEPIYPGKVWFL